MCPKYCDSPAGLGQPRISSPATFSFEWPYLFAHGPRLFFSACPKGKRLESTASRVQEPLLGGGGGSYSSLYLWFPHGLRAWNVSDPDACWANQHRGRSVAEEGCVGQRPLQVTIWRAAEEKIGGRGGLLRCLQVCQSRGLSKETNLGPGNIVPWGTRVTTLHKVLNMFPWGLITKLGKKK